MFLGLFMAGRRGYRQGMSLLAAVAIAFAALEGTIAVPPPTPAPYVTVYRDEAVSFQVRRDKLTVLGENAYRVWLRWLWAEPRAAESRVEISALSFSEVDCAGLRVRDLATMKKAADGGIFDVVEIQPEEARWRSFGSESGATAAMRRLCTFLPELSRTRGEEEKE